MNDATTDADTVNSADPVTRIPEMYRALFTRVFQPNPSRAAAVKAKCLDCSNFQRVEIEHCPAKSCPLWQIRPYVDRPKRPHHGQGFKKKTATSTGTSA
jgi:hypothetical protein